jgi:hypothetical protein
VEQNFVFCVIRVFASCGGYGVVANESGGTFGLFCVENLVSCTVSTELPNCDEP